MNYGLSTIPLQKTASESGASFSLIGASPVFLLNVPSQAHKIAAALTLQVTPGHAILTTMLQGLVTLQHACLLPSHQVIDLSVNPYSAIRIMRRKI